MSSNRRFPSLPAQLWAIPGLTGRSVFNNLQPLVVIVSTGDGTGKSPDGGPHPARVSGVAIEDDYDSEFRYDKQPVGSLQGLAADRVVSVGSVSKSLAPAIRLGWVLTPRQLRARIAEEKYRSDRGSPTLDQLALARLIESGRFDRHPAPHAQRLCRTAQRTG